MAVTPIARVCSSDRSRSASASGNASLRSASTPATWGAAAEVPPKFVPDVAFPAPVGASRSGLKRPSVVGPREEYAASVRVAAIVSAPTVTTPG